MITIVKLQYIIVSDNTQFLEISFSTHQPKEYNAEISPFPHLIIIPAGFSGLCRRKYPVVIYLP
jgi:hypothetical protein